ncbi:MAG: YkgJ family cysteine cluster protein [Planctomycetota bacterium]|nr:YkgJ family cysteine cluster protein [Planctomycetota bacterium]
MSKGTAAPWFGNGLRFSCVAGCLRCCTGAPGDVLISPEELRRIAAHLGLPAEEFEAGCVRHYSSGKISLTERSNGDCVLLNNQGCSVYAVRPRQCRDYPFWPEIVRSPRTWQREARRCPGINAGELHAASRIMELLQGPEGR